MSVGSLPQEIQSLLINWKGPDLTTYGELVLEATFRVHRVRNERTFFLFDKILLITKKRGDHFVYKGHIPVTMLSSLPLPSLFLYGLWLQFPSGFIGLWCHLLRLASRVGGSLPLLLNYLVLCPPQCSSLMLIESTRDSLCFTVTHYKHSKQQYSIQVRNGLGEGLGTKPSEHTHMTLRSLAARGPSVSIC